MNIPRISFLTFLSAIVLSTIVLSVILISACMFFVVARGEYLDPTIRVNVNKQTDLFEKSVDDYSSFAGQLEEQKDTAAGGAKSEAGLEFLVKEDKSKITATADSLAAIPATELNARAAEAVMQDDTMNDLYVDYSSPLNKQAIIDATKIAKGQDALLANLLDKLKEIGVDCRTLKGVKEQEPAYYMQIQQIQHQDTVYNRAICEELRNQYNCRDSVSLTCKRKGKGYGKWEDRKIKFSGHTLHWNKMNWGYAIKWKRKRWGWHITPYHPRYGEIQRDSPLSPEEIIADARKFIAEHLKVDLEQIGENVVFPDSGRGIGNIGGVGCRWRVVWDEYEFGYQFREVYDICKQWSEDWTESCHLNSLAKPVVNKAGQRGK